MKVGGHFNCADYKDSNIAQYLETDKSEERLINIYKNP